jgi:hypothetical protein
MKTGDEVRPFLAMPTDIEKELDKVYGTQMADDEAPMSEQQLDDVAEEKTREIMESFRDSDQVETVKKKADLLEVDASAPEVERIINAMICPRFSRKRPIFTLNPLKIRMEKSPG